MRYKPQLSSNARPATYTVEAHDETGALVPTPIAGEHPLTLYVDKREIVTLMTLGAAPEALAIGFLRNQRLVESIEEIVSVNVDWEVNAVAVTTRNGLVDLDKKTEKRTATTGCGQGTVFGDLMADIESIRLDDGMRVDEETLFELLNAVRTHESISAIRSPNTVPWPQPVVTVRFFIFSSRPSSPWRVVMATEAVSQSTCTAAIASMDFTRRWLRR